MACRPRFALAEQSKLRTFPTPQDDTAVLILLGIITKTSTPTHYGVVTLQAPLPDGGKTLTPTFGSRRRKRRTYQAQSGTQQGPPPSPPRHQLADSQPRHAKGGLLVHLGRSATKMGIKMKMKLRFSKGTGERSEAAMMKLFPFENSTSYTGAVSVESIFPSVAASFWSGLGVRLVIMCRKASRIVVDVRG